MSRNLYPHGYSFKPGSFEGKDSMIILVPLGLCLLVAFIVCFCSCWWKSYLDRHYPNHSWESTIRTSNSSRTRSGTSASTVQPFIDIPPSYEEAVLMPLVRIVSSPQGGATTESSKNGSPGGATRNG